MNYASQQFSIFLKLILFSINQISWIFESNAQYA